MNAKVPYCTSRGLFLHVKSLALAKAVPNAQQRTLEGQTHDGSPEVLAPVLAEFFNA